MSSKFSGLSQKIDEFNEERRLIAERKMPAELFFNDTGNPFIGFLKFLKRQPQKLINPEALKNDISDISRVYKKNDFFGKLAITFFAAFFIIIVILVISVCINNDFASALENSPIGIILMVLFALSVIFMFFVNNKDKSGKNGYSEEDYKTYIVNRALYNKIDELIYEPNFGIPYSVASGTKLLPYMVDYNTKDYITGKYNGIYFVSACLCMSMTSSEGGSYDFDGEWLIFKSSKPFKGTLTLSDRSMNMFIRIPTSSNIDKQIKVENEEFNKLFYMESSDQELAYYLLTPQMIEKIIQLKNMLSGNLLIGFCNGYIHIGINKGLKLVNIDYKNANIYSDIETLLDNFNNITEIIETFESDTNIYKF